MFNPDKTPRVFRVSYSSPSQAKYGNTSLVIAEDAQTAINEVLKVIPDAAVVTLSHLGKLLRSTPVEKQNE